MIAYVEGKRLNKVKQITIKLQHGIYNVTVHHDNGSYTNFEAGEVLNLGNIPYFRKLPYKLSIESEVN